GRRLAAVSRRRRGRVRGCGARRRFAVAEPRRRCAMKAAAVAVAVVAALLAASPAAAAGGLSVTVDRTAISTALGRKFELRSTISNRGAAPAAGLIAHLNVFSLRPGVYVDPEDWSSHRTRYLAPIPPGGSTTIVWRLAAVSSGSIGVYVAVLPRS